MSLTPLSLPANQWTGLILVWFFLGLLLQKADAGPPPIAFAPACGLNIRLSTLRPGDLARFHEAGFTWVRTDLFWAEIERSRGHYDFSSFDRFVAELDKQHLRAVLILDYGNPLYVPSVEGKPHGSRINSDEFRLAYAAFSTAAVAHYAGRGFIWEQWNEPNTKQFWSPAPDGDEYVALMKPAGAAIRQKFPQEILIGPATSGVDFKFIEACLKGGMLDSWSGISIHPYRRSEPGTVAADYARLRALIAKYAAPGRAVPIICGEWGYSTAWKGIDDFQQADYLTQMFQLNEREGIPLTIWYDWRDDGDDPANQEHRFGLVRRSPLGLFAPKPAYFAARRALITVP